jgi:hypothetical protein
MKRPGLKMKIACAFAMLAALALETIVPVEALEERTSVSAPGDVEWVRQFGSLEGGHDYARAVDANGNLYVAGEVSGTLPGQSGSGGTDAFVRKYDFHGNGLWTRQFGSTSISGDDEASGVAVDANGNIYVAGFTDGAFEGQTNSGGENAFLRKYDAGGNELWTRQFEQVPPPGGYRGHFLSIAVGASSVFVAGTTVTENAFVRRYDASGAQVWTRVVEDSEDDSQDDVRGVAVDTDSNVYVSGSTDGILPGQTGAGGMDAFVRKYDAGGNEVWTRQFGSAAFDETRGVAVDNSGVYVAGLTTGEISTDFSDLEDAGFEDAFVRKYDADGNELWTRQLGAYGGGGYLFTSRDEAMGVTVGPTGIYVVGVTDGTFGDNQPNEPPPFRGQDVFVRKYDADGNRIWTSQFDANGTEDDDRAIGIAVDGRNLFLVGSTRGTFPGQVGNGQLDAFVAKIADPPNTPPVADNKTSSGEQNTVQTITLNGSDVDAYCDLLFTIVTPPSHGTLIATGSSHDTGNGITASDCHYDNPYPVSATVAYTPDANYHGPDSFTYQVTDTGNATPPPTYDSATTRNLAYSTSSPLHSRYPLSSNIATVSITVNAGDLDGDGIRNDVDNCPTTANADQINTDGDAQGDACDEDDDNDGVSDATDNCPLVANPSQANNDGDAQGDVCDPDDDNDGVADTADNCRFVANPNQANNDGDNLGDVCDPDDDNDGVPDNVDNCPLVPNPNQANADGDALGDACDPTPNGDIQIVFSSNRDGNFEIYGMRTDGTGVVRLTNNGASDLDPALSPDKTRIIFASNRDGNFEIYVMNANGTGVTRLTNNSAVDGFAAWSPTGAKIVFTSTRDGNSEIYSMNADGTGVMRLTNHSKIDGNPA